MAVYGCEPRVDYSRCDASYHASCPIFYVVALIAQLIPFFVFGRMLAKSICAAWWAHIAPHEAPSWRAVISGYSRRLKFDTVLQLKLGTFVFTFSAVLHHCSLLTPNRPLLPPLVIEYLYNLYNIFLIATIANTLRCWQEFIARSRTMAQWMEAEMGFFDKWLCAAFTWKGSATLVSFTCCFCIGTDTWGMMDNDPSTWSLVVRMQHFQFACICSFIAASCVRIGYLQERQIQRILSEQELLLQYDNQLLHAMKMYRLILRLSYLANCLVWIACCVVCSLGGIFFDDFYRVGFWIFLMSAFNLVGCFYAGVTFAISSTYARTVELQLHDLLVFCVERNDGDAVALKAAIANLETGMAPKDSAFRRSGCRDSRNVHRAQSVHASYSEAAYPCFVMSLRNLMSYKRIPSHEVALRDGKLDILTETSYYPCRSYCFFLSHEWINQMHPDGDECDCNPKLSWIKRKGSLLLGGTSNNDEIFFWMDFFSIPQSRETGKSRQCFLEALHALPYYTFICNRIIPLVRDLPAIDSYLRRGWCNAECICAITPKVTQTGYWRIGPMPGALRFRFFGYSSAAVQEQEWKDQGRSATSVPRDAWLHFRKMRNPCDPNETSFTDENDRYKIIRILRVFASVLDAYKKAGTTSWNHTMDLADVPQWLFALGRDSSTCGAQYVEEHLRSSTESMAIECIGSILDTEMQDYSDDNHIVLNERPHLSPRCALGGAVDTSGDTTLDSSFMLRDAPMSQDQNNEASLCPQRQPSEGDDLCSIISV